MYRDDAEYLREWIEFHQLVGVERFFLYNNFSQDDHRQVLAPYVEQGTVVLTDWPKPFLPTKGGLMKAYEHCLEHAESRWIAFIDIDEFLFSPTGKPLPEILSDYEAFPGVVANWAMFGTSGHKRRPPGLVIENYVCRTNRPQFNTHFKSIVDPRRVNRPRNAHFFSYRDGVAVDENKQRVTSTGKTDSVSFERLRVNHYWSKSEEECREKLELWQAVGDETRTLELVKQQNALLNDVLDKTILKYLSPLRGRLSTLAPR